MLIDYRIKAHSEDCSIYLLAECTLSFKRSAEASGTITSIETEHLVSTVDQVSIDITVPSKLVACKDTYSDLSTCTEYAAN